MRLLALIGFLAIVVAVAAAVFFFGGYYSVAASDPHPAIVDWVLIKVRQASVAKHADAKPGVPLDDPATIQAGARAYSQRGCATCHGRVDQMNQLYQTASLHMEWCLQCHRNPEQFVRPRSEVFNMEWSADDQTTLGPTLVAEHKIESRDDCTVCHR